MSASRRAWLTLLLFALGPLAAAQNQQWIRQFGTSSLEAASAAALDGLGGVYVSGYTGGDLGGPNAGSGDAWVAQYDGEGNPLWIRQFGTISTDLAFAAAPDGLGGVYASGYTGGSLGGPNAGNLDAWVAHFDGAGNQLWIRQLGTSSQDRAYAAAPDGSGGVYVSGYTFGSLGGPSAGGYDAWVAHYDGAGTLLWIRQFGTSSTDIAYAAAPDGSGGVYVSGSTGGSLGGPSVGGDDAWVAHYDGAGNQIWIRQLGTIWSDGARAAAPDGSGGVYVSGYTGGSLGGPSAGGGDAWVAHYDGAGNPIWIRQFGTSASDQANAAAPDGMGGVYVGGLTYGSLGGPSAGPPDAWIAHYDGVGNQTWIRQFGWSVEDTALGAAPDGSGGVYVSGFTGSIGGPPGGIDDAWLARYTANLGTAYCTPAFPNSTGLPGVITATGSDAVIDNDVTLIANQLPPGQFGYFIIGQTQGMFMPPGSQGFICLMGNIGRYNAVPDIIQGPTGNLALDLTAMPVNPPQAVLPGETWNFQCWYRDTNPGLTSNFTDGVSVVFQ